MNKAEVFEQIKKIGIIPAMRSTDGDIAARAAHAICLGGIPIIEISMSMPNVENTLKKVVEKCGADMLVGAGTVTTGQDVRVAKEYGAQFIVTSGFSAEVVQVAAEYSLAIFAGALTPTEVQTAREYKVDAVKLFPCYSVGGPRYLKSLRTQYPETDFIASGGVDLHNCMDYFRAGACAIGVGGEIADSDSLAAGDYRVFTVRAKRFRKAIEEVRHLMGQ